jgi:hypothetical protein
MKRLLHILLFLLPVISLLGQVQSGKTQLEGTVSYITSQNVYVKFPTTKGISPGDTLYLTLNNRVVPALIVNDLSSISCVCSTIGEIKLKVSDRISANIIPLKPPEPEKQFPITDSVVVIRNEPEDSIHPEKQKKELKQEIHGRLGISSYTNFSNTPSTNTQKMRYTFSMLANNLGDSKLSAETYISFVHDNIHWDEVKKNIFYGLKIYAFNLRYDFNDSTHLWLGRKINPRVSTMGANDGLQFEKKFGSVTAGVIAGLRPDYQDYGINSKLFQFGAYVSHDVRTRAGNMQNTLAVVNQTNDWNTDRRYIYFQHSNTLASNLYFFGNAELDLYQKANGQEKTTLTLSSLYLMLRYRIIKQLSVTASYNTRRNIIYYETYKDVVDKLLNRLPTQGYRLQVTYRPIRFLSIGAAGSYRFSKLDPEPSKNFYGYLTYSRIPVLNLSATASATILKTSYLSGKIYSFGIMKDLLNGRLNAGINYRYIHYDYTTSEMKTTQNVGEASLSWLIYRKLSLGVYYEGTFEGSYTFNRIYVNLTQRF